MIRVGFFSGSFDPMTNGHLDVIEHAAALCDRLVVGVGSNPNKAALFSVEERVAMVQAEAAALNANGTKCQIDVKPFDNLLMHFAVENGAGVIIRGLRAVTDRKSVV